MGRRRETLIALAVVATVVAGAVVVVMLVRGGDSPRTAAPPPTTTTTKKPPPKPKPLTRYPPALVVKIDSVARSRPHVGLARSDAIYVQPVEGGLSRMLAVYWGKRPGTLGPVRSARETDVELLAQFRKPVLAYSGVAPELKGMIARSSIVPANPNNTGGAFYRVGGRQSPHNMFVNPHRLPSTKPVRSPLMVGAPPKGGTRMSSYHVGYRAASYDFSWSGKAKRWMVSQNGAPLITTERGRMTAGTVVVQRVKIVRGRVAGDAAGSYSPVARTVGKGKALVLRDGKAFRATWSRSATKKPTVLKTPSGKVIRYAPGRVWVLLVPA